MSRKISSDIQEIIDLLKLKRKEASVTQLDLANTTNVSQSRISKIESGMGINDLIFWLNYLDKLSIKSEYILNISNTKNLQESFTPKS